MEFYDLKSNKFISIDTSGMVPRIGDYIELSMYNEMYEVKKVVIRTRYASVFIYLFPVGDTEEALDEQS
jgi:hypothetical protein